MCNRGAKPWTVAFLLFCTRFPLPVTTTDQILFTALPSECIYICCVEVIKAEAMILTFLNIFLFVFRKHKPANLLDTPTHAQLKDYGLFFLSFHAQFVLIIQLLWCHFHYTGAMLAGCNQLVDKNLSNAATFDTYHSTTHTTM